MRSIAALALLVAGTALLPAANAQHVTVHVDTPEFGFRIGHPGGHGVVGYPVPVYPAPVYAPPPVIVVPRPVYPAPIYLPPPRVIVPRPIYAPAPVYYTYGRGYGYGYPPGHYRKHDKHHRHHRYDNARYRYGRDDD